MLACLAAGAVLAQGTISFSNYNPSAGINAPVYHGYGPVRLNGPPYQAALYAGPTELNLALIATTPFLSGSNAGYFNGGLVVVPAVLPGGVAYCDVVAWDTTLGGTTTGATAEQAFAYMEAGHIDVWGSYPSAYGGGPLQIVTGDPTAIPPGLPAPLSGLQPFTLIAPEPSALALTGLAAALLVLRRRKTIMR